MVHDPPRRPPRDDACVRALAFTPREFAELMAAREAIKHGFPEEAVLLGRLLTGWRLHKHGWIGR